MERFTQMSPEDTFGTTLKVCSCINRCFTISFLFFFFQHVLIFLVLLNLHMSVKTVVKGDLKGVYTEKDSEKGKQGLWTILILSPQQPLNKQF